MSLALPLRVALVGSLLLATACTVPPVRLAEGPREYVATDYPFVMRQWTREKKLIDLEDVDNVLTVTTTFESWDFRWAYVVRYAEDYRLTVEQRQSLLARALAETRQNHQFYVALYAQRHSWGDLNARQPQWVVRLVDEVGNETAPVQIEAVRSVGAMERTYFPYSSPWRRVFRVRFPVRRADGRPTIDPRATWFGLRFAGAQGNQELVWEVDGSKESAAPAPAPLK